MAGADFRSGFATGAVVGVLAGIGGLLAFKAASAGTSHRILRLEKSVNIGRPIETVFNAWTDFERLPERIPLVRSVQRTGNHSHWKVGIDGKDFEWEALLTQIVPNESIGWKSLRGPKHSGRISFARLENQTVVHVTMNYAPPLGEFGSMLPIEQHLEHWIERGLREFKAALESDTALRTGTGDAVTANQWSTGPVGIPGEHAAPGTVDYTRPPEAGY